MWQCHQRATAAILVWVPESRAWDKDLDIGNRFRRWFPQTGVKDQTEWDREERKGNKKYIMIWISVWVMWAQLPGNSLRTDDTMSLRFFSPKNGRLEHLCSNHQSHQMQVALGNFNFSLSMAEQAQGFRKSLKQKRTKFCKHFRWDTGSMLSNYCRD